jgi:adenylate cyclase
VATEHVEVLTRDALAERAGVDAAFVQRLEAAGVLAAGADGAFAPGDIYRVRLLDACERAGLRVDAIAEAIRRGALSLSFMDLPHYRWAAITDRTWQEVADEMDLDVELVLDAVQAQGYVRPGPRDRVRQDEGPILGTIKLAATMLDHDAIVRTVRVYVDSLRRIVDAETAVFDAFVVGGFQRMGLTFAEAVDLANRFGADSTHLQEETIVTLYRRQQERGWTEYTVEGIERVLEELGLYERPERPPAFAFVDLAGYTALTERRGDEAGARLAADLAAMVERATTGRGQPVKWLGDGVMVYFRDPREAVRATLDVVRAAPRLGLPAHAGVAAGAAVFQDGDYFGRVVNLAARVASRAEAGRTLVTEEVARLAEGPDVSFSELGPVELKGFAEPVRVFEAVPVA